MKQKNIYIGQRLQSVRRRAGLRSQEALLDKVQVLPEVLNLSEDERGLLEERGWLKTLEANSAKNILPNRILYYLKACLLADENCTNVDEVQDIWNTLYKGILSSQNLEWLFGGKYINSTNTSTYSPLDKATSPTINLNTQKEVLVQMGRTQSAGLIPRRPHLIGREDDAEKIKSFLEAGTRNIVIRGWPGVGKSALAALLANDPQMSILFPDAILWTNAEKTEEDNLFSSLVEWAQTLGTPELASCKTTQELSNRLRWILRDKKVIFFLDDVQSSKSIEPLLVGGVGSAIVSTTRYNDVAQSLALTTQPVYVHRLEVLTSQKAFELLVELAPSAVSLFPQQATEFIEFIEKLPLALQVAGRLLRIEIDRGLNVEKLLLELQEGSKLLEAELPIGLVSETRPTVALLLKKSTDYLDTDQRHYFSLLGGFAPKPALFNLPFLNEVWKREPPKGKEAKDINVEKILGNLVDRGLLEYNDLYYSMHALLVLLAESMLDQEGN